MLDEVLQIAVRAGLHVPIPCLGFTLLRDYKTLHNNKAPFSVLGNMTREELARALERGSAKDCHLVNARSQVQQQGNTQ